MFIELEAENFPWKNQFGLLGFQYNRPVFKENFEFVTML